MAYQDAVRYLNSLIDYEKRTPGKYDTETYNLDAFRSLLHRLGNPERDFDSIHVAGTDGKGSTCAFLESILRHAGLRTGFYSSPHLSAYTERIRLDGSPIGGEEFGSLIFEIRDALEADRRGRSEPERRGFATVFEMLTAAAFLVFARARVDAAIVEVGLGGRLDATNVITPRLSVITPVDRDHTRLLGTSPGQIAREKGGIIKAGVPVVISAQSDEVSAVLEPVAREKESRFIRSDDRYALSDVHCSPAEYRFRLQGKAGVLTDLRTSLLGRHQTSNARTAVAAAEEFTRGRGTDLTPEQIREGVARTRWPGRCEPAFLSGRESERIRCVLDCAHTPQAGHALRRTLEEIYPQPKLVFLLSLSADKQIPDFLRTVLRAGDIVVATRSDSPRAMDPEELSGLAGRILSEIGPGEPQRCHVTPDWESGLREAVRIAEETDRIICVAGSIYLVGLVRSRAGITQTE
jgi:dihydrofolate synthase/folylpolyglutamate synthase